MLTPREKSPLPKMSPEEDRTRDAVDSEPKHYQLSYSGPRWFLLFLTETGTFSVMGSLLYVLGPCECHSIPTIEMHVPLRSIPKGVTLCFRLYKLDN